MAPAHKQLLLAGALIFHRSSITTSNESAILGSFVDKSNFFRGVHAHPHNKISSTCSIAIFLSFFLANPQTCKFMMNCSVMDGNEPIFLQKSQELVKEVVWIDMYEFKQVI